jgi:hypothetical protein
MEYNYVSNIWNVNKVTIQSTEFFSPIFETHKSAQFYAGIEKDFWKQNVKFIHAKISLRLV